MNWTAFDFIVFAAMIASVGGAFFLALRRTKSRKYRTAAGVALATAFILVWANGAVGIIGDENNDANLMYFGVLAIAIVGASIARFKARGMARAMYATAAAQTLVAVIALLIAPGPLGPAWPKDILIVTAFFASLWLLAARLFQLAAAQAE
jgi:hypothetical protein